MKTLTVADQFIPTSLYAEAFAQQPNVPHHEVAAVTWNGDKATQHHAQQVMERHGPSAIDVPGEIRDAIAPAQALCVHFAPVSARLMEAAPQLRLIAVARAGLENVDIPAATERGIAVTGVQGRNASAVAELQIGLMLTEARDIARADASVKSGGWRKTFSGPRFEIAGRTVGMVGFGQVGARFARKLRGFAPRMLAYDPFLSAAELAEHGVEATGLNEVFASSDYVVVQARHSADTDRFLGDEQFGLMPPHGYFINVARSRVVDTDALYRALHSGSIAGAGLDVHDEEPLTDDSRWRGLDNVTLTTHFGGDTEETGHTSARLVAEAVNEFAGTGRCGSAVNATALGWT